MMMMNTTDTNFTNMYNNYSSLLPLSGTTTVSENLIPSQSPSNNPFITDFLRQKISTVKPDTIFAYNNNVVSFPQKRSRDSINNYPFINEDFSQYIHHQNTDIDNFISQHVNFLPYSPKFLFFLLFIKKKLIFFIYFLFACV